MNIDFKVTTWERVEISNDIDQKKVIKLIKEGVINNSNDLWRHFPSGELDYMQLIETAEPMTVKENGGNSTIEIFEGGEIIYGNGDLT